ncbi:MAG: GNAT family N-acetyltransferase [Candidatus Pacearchaeota archaeon]
MQDIKIRLFDKKDLNTLSEIYTETYKRFDVGEKWSIFSSYKLLDYWLNRQPDLCFLIEYKGKIVGAFVAGVKPWWDGNHLVDGEIFIHPDYQNKGLGKILSKHMYEQAVAKYHVIRFDTYTFKMTKFPLAWYKSQGFEEIKEWAMISADLREVLKHLK